MKYIRNYTDLQHLVNSIIPIIPYIELTLVRFHYFSNYVTDIS